MFPYFVIEPKGFSSVFNPVIFNIDFHVFAFQSFVSKNKMRMSTKASQKAAYAASYATNLTQDILRVPFRFFGYRA